MKIWTFLWRRIEMIWWSLVWMKCVINLMYITISSHVWRCLLNSIHSISYWNELKILFRKKIRPRINSSVSVCEGKKNFDSIKWFLTRNEAEDVHKEENIGASVWVNRQKAGEAAVCSPRRSASCQIFTSSSHSASFETPSDEPAGFYQLVISESCLQEGAAQFEGFCWHISHDSNGSWINVIVIDLKQTRRSFWKKDLITRTSSW